MSFDFFNISVRKGDSKTMVVNESKYAVAPRTLSRMLDDGVRQIAQEVITGIVCNNRYHLDDNDIPMSWKELLESVSEQDLANWLWDNYESEFWEAHNEKGYPLFRDAIEETIQDLEMNVARVLWSQGILDDDLELSDD